MLGLGAQETDPQLGVAILLVGGGYLFFSSPTSEIESEIWGRRYALMPQNVVVPAPDVNVSN
jgi:hypothetical protein